MKKFNTKYWCVICQEDLNEKSTQSISLTQRTHKFEKHLNEDYELRQQRIIALMKNKLEIRIKLKEELSKLEGLVGPETKNLNVIFNKIAVTPQLYFQQFTGNMIRRVLQKVDYIYNNLSEKLQTSQTVKDACEALRRMGIVQG